MGPPPVRPGTHTETRYYIDPKGKTYERQVRVPDGQPLPQQQATQPEYRYYRRPDGTMVRQKVAPGQPRARAPPAPARPPPPARTPPPARSVVHRNHLTPRWTAKRVLKHVVVIAVIVLLLMWPSTIPNMKALVTTLLTGEAAFQPFPETADITLERVNTLTSSGRITWHINISRPFHIPGIHELKDLDTSPGPTANYVYKDQDWMYWEGTIPNGGGSASLRITYHMKLYSTVWKVDEESSASVSDIPASYSKYLGDEWKINPSNAQVQALSRDIVGDETDVYTILFKIYKWMDDNLDYNTQRSAEPKSCTQTLSDGGGDCDDQSILLASLARAAGVPVWLNLGIIYDPVRSYWGGHGWNNVFIPLEDGTHVIATVDIVNNQFLFRDPYHVSDYIDNGDGQDLQNYYTSWSYSYPSPPSPAPRVSSKEVYTILDIKTTGSIVYTAP